MLHLTQADFDQTIASWVVMVDFFADWCGPCQILGKLMPHLSTKYEWRAIVAKVNTDEQKYLAWTYNIMSLPTVIVFKDGVEVEKMKWLLPPEVYSEVLDKWLASE